jgi:hypothetical protein
MDDPQAINFAHSSGESCWFQYRASTVMSAESFLAKNPCVRRFEQRQPNLFIDHDWAEPQDTRLPGRRWSQRIRWRAISARTNAQPGSTSQLILKQMSRSLANIDPISKYMLKKSNLEARIAKLAAETVPAALRQWMLVRREGTSSPGGTQAKCSDREENVNRLP